MVPGPRTRFTRLGARAVLIALGAIAIGGWRGMPAATSASLEGTWRLVDQRYASGERNLAAEETRLVLRIGPPGSGKAGSRSVEIEADGQGEAGAPFRLLEWPAFVTDEGPRPVRLLAREAKDEEVCLQARYEVRPSDSDGLSLRIEERYCLAEDGQGLAGDMTVRFVEGAAERGSFVLHRRFEREP